MATKRTVATEKVTDAPNKRIGAKGRTANRAKGITLLAPGRGVAKKITSLYAAAKPAQGGFLRPGVGKPLPWATASRKGLLGDERNLIRDDQRPMVEPTGPQAFPRPEVTGQPMQKSRKR